MHWYPLSGLKLSILTTTLTSPHNLNITILSYLYLAHVHSNNFFHKKKHSLKMHLLTLACFFSKWSNGNFFIPIYKVEKMNLRDFKWLTQAYVTQVRLEPRCIEESFIEILWCVMHRMNIIKTNMALPWFKSVSKKSNLRKYMSLEISQRLSLSHSSF